MNRKIRKQETNYVRSTTKIALPLKLVMCPATRILQVPLLLTMILKWVLRHWTSIRYTFCLSVNMSSEFVYLCSLVVFLSFLSTSSVDCSSTPSPTTQPTTTVSTTTLQSNNVTIHNNDTKGIMDTLRENKGMLMRAFYVLIGVTAIVVVYFGVRAWR